MNTPVLASTFLLTLLLAVGLFFFIKASVKDRTERVKLTADRAEETLLAQLQQYFSQRAYRVTAIDATQHQVTFEGVVRASWFLAIFLTILSAVGLLCLALVLSMLLPQGGELFLGFVLLSPLAGLFYWKKAERSEQVSLKLEALASSGTTAQSLITVTAHRDELIALQRALDLKPFDILPTV